MFSLPDPPGASTSEPGTESRLPVDEASALKSGNWLLLGLRAESHKGYNASDTIAYMSS